MDFYSNEIAFWTSIVSSILFIISELLAYSKCEDHGICKVLVSFSKRLLNINTPVQLVEAIEQEIIADIPS